MTEINPYLSPVQEGCYSKKSAELTREAMAELIQRFLNSELTAFEFAEQLEAFQVSQDPMIKYAADTVWYFFDDCKDHYVCLEKPDWDFLQRILLALKSDCQIEVCRSRRWSMSQGVAAGALAAYAYLAFQVGWGSQLYILAIPFGLISMAISFSREQNDCHKSPASPWTQIIYPFASFADLAAAYRTSNFRKTRFPREISERSIRSPFMGSVLMLQSYIMWLLHGPLVLFAQAFPKTNQDVRILARHFRAG